MALFKKKKQGIKQEEKKVSEKKKIKIGTSHRVLMSACITEKSTGLIDKNKYVFKVFPSSTKPEIKKAIEQVYNVDVSSVRTINVARKRKRLGKTIGWTKAYKKAMIDLKKGQEIEIVPR